MPETAAAGLSGQAARLAEAAESAAAWFRRPLPETLVKARTARHRAAGSRERAVAELRGRAGGSSAARADEAELSFRLREAAEHAARAVAEAARAGLPADPELAGAAEALARGARGLERALSLSGRGGEEALVEAKRWAAACEIRRRAARRRAHDDPAFVRGLARERSADSLSRAAEALQQAIDARAGELPGAGDGE